jgi:hypothetical protein
MIKVFKARITPIIYNLFYSNKFVKVSSFALMAMFFIFANLNYYSQNLEAIEEPTFYGFQGLIHYLNFVRQNNVDLDNYNFVLLLIPESIIDWLLNYLFNFDASKIWISRHIFRQILIFGLLLSVLLKLIGDSFLPLVLVLFSSTSQVLFKAHWDAGSTYSFAWFLALIYFFINSNHSTPTKKSQIFIIVMSFITLPGYTNPPNMLASWTVVIVGFALNFAIQRDFKFNFKILLGLLWTIPSIFIFALTVLFDASISNDIKIFSSIQPAIVPISQWTQIFQGFGLWWTNGTFLNGTFFWPHAQILTNRYIEFIRLFVLIFPFLAIFLLSQDVRIRSFKQRNRIHLILGLSVSLYFILTINIFNIFGFLVDLNSIFSMYRDPARKFGSLYFALLIMYIAYMLKIIQSFYSRIVMIYSILTVTIITSLFSPDIKRGHSYFPNPSVHSVLLIDKNVEVVLNQRQSKDQGICLHRSGQLDYDYLVKNIFKSKIYNQVKGNFANLDIDLCDQVPNTPNDLSVVIVDPEKQVDIFFDSESSLLSCQLKWTSSLFVVDPDCRVEIRQTSQKSVSQFERFMGPENIIAPEFYDYPFYVISFIGE